MTPNPQTCDRPPSPRDYQTDLAKALATYRTDSAHIPGYALAFMALQARRALHAEKLLATLYGCTSIHAVKAILKQSGIPGLDDTATPPGAPREADPSPEATIAP